MTDDEDSTLKRDKEELYRLQALTQSSRSSLWSALLTINGIFIAFTLNQDSWPPSIHLLFMVLFIIPAIITLWLFYLAKYSSNENLNAQSMAIEMIKKVCRHQDPHPEAKSTLYHFDKAEKPSRALNSIGIILEKVAIIITGLSIFGMILLVIFSN
jgi:hypothetical protein